LRVYLQKAMHILIIFPELKTRCGFNKDQLVWMKSYLYKKSAI